jgi:hypothetical protein
MRDPEKIPITEVTDAELSALHAKYSRPDEKPFEADLSDAAWVKAETEAQEELDRKMLVSTIEGLSLSARLVRLLSGERDQVPADRTIGFVSDGGLERNPLAAMIAVREYEAFPKGDATPENVLEKLLDFFCLLESRFESMGVYA